MIKVYNKKSLNDIEELREKGLYNAPFSVQENANGVKIESPDTKALEEKIKVLEEKLAVSEETIEELNADLDALVGGSDE